MSSLGKILSSGIFPRIGQEPASTEGLRAFLERGSYQPASPFDGKRFRLDRVPIVDFTPGISFDFERFALSCRESNRVAFAEKAAGNVVSWPLLKLYYSAFFGAHAILRSRGAGVSFFTSKDLSKLDEVFQAYFAGSPKIRGGSYFFTVDFSSGYSGEISLEFEVADQKSGVHESFWYYFTRYLDQAASLAVASGMPDSSLFVSEVSALKELLTDGGGGGIWVSTMRNSVNYQHSHEVWNPVRRGSEAGGLFSALPSMPLGRIEKDKVKRPLRVFLDTCLYVSEVSDTLGDFVAERSTKGGAFGQKWRRLKEILG